ncbi:hypothetical protein [Pseudophaeobacter flagellatus]|uniref:hypothetical protein n=1 Tax=Pseudophaeobacter flagellatus TaxID=2899119 RepID=UPI001E57E247|nr:hypothetical protein [Pseudophaeobacter flagellatus]MCD9147934.1 hypothetical protein [Pseudophaeobacter flagellatus]
MTDIKKQLSNVAFGGSWSEEILSTASLKAALHVINQAAEECAERDVATEELEEALGYIRAKIGKGSELAGQFSKAIRDPDQVMRKQGALRVAKSITRWAGR